MWLFLGWLLADGLFSPHPATLLGLRARQNMLFGERTKPLSLRIPTFQASNLNSIFEQLQGPSIRRVLRALDQSKSTYCTTFARLCKEVWPPFEPRSIYQLLSLTPYVSPSSAFCQQDTHKTFIFEMHILEKVAL